MFKQFISRLWKVVKYVPSSAIKLAVTLHIVLIIPIGRIFNENGYPDALSIWYSALILTVTIYPVLIFIYWRIHHGKSEQ